MPFVYSLDREPTLADKIPCLNRFASALGSGREPGIPHARPFTRAPIQQNGFRFTFLDPADHT